ncbi:MAG: ubiquinol-cytochrome C chaperone family protein [Magnetococcales bacterium]|nr:ubiquinol-cytochrome C chaperone family protein [Magnetococcales bacterium]
MMGIGFLRSGNRDREVARQRVMALHGRIVEEVLEWTAGDRLGVADRFSLRFEVMVLAVSVVMVSVKEDRELVQGLWDMTFEGFEESLRGRGVNDIRIGSRMRELIQHAMGRSRAYMDALNGHDTEALGRAIVRNVFGGEPPRQETVEILLSSVLNLPNRVSGGINS